MLALDFQGTISRQIIDAIPDGLLVVAADGSIVNVNRHALTLFGYTEDELLEQPIELLVPEAARAGHPARRAGFLAGGTTRPMGSGLDISGRRKDGTLVPIDVSLTRLETADGPVAIAAVRDVSDRSAMLAALRDTQERYRLLIDNAPEIFFHVQLPGDPLRSALKYVSNQITKFTGIPPEEFVADPQLWASCLHPDDVESVSAATEEILSTRSAGTRTYRLRHAETGGYRWLEDRIMPTLDEAGRVDGFQGVAWDISDRVRSEAEHERLEGQLRQAMKMEAVGRLAAGIAHDFNNLLSVILGYAQTIQVSLEPEAKAYQDLAEINAAARRAADLTAQLLAFGRQQPITPRRLGLAAELRTLEGMLRRTIGEDVRLVVAPSPELWDVFLDPTQFAQIVINLAVNARDAMEEGGVLTITLDNVRIDEAHPAAHPGSTPGDYAVLSVSDTGNGMDRGALEHAFEPFYTTKGPGKGTGLGLATVYGIATQNEGFAQIFSEPGQGTTVKVYLPRYRGTELPEVVFASNHSPPGGHETILVVEDDLQLRRLTCRMLQRLGYDVIEAQGPEAALALIQEPGRHIDLLLTDVVMPNMSGVTLADLVFEQRPDIRTIYMSGYPADLIARRGLRLEGIHHLQKPFDRLALAAKVREVLERQVTRTHGYKDGAPGGSGRRGCSD
ncbi:MAG TPA: PAS domain S-box protein, partial [Gemmatimonadales bacterium]|nr:PAS domain S-box protein [Gemmatimonadales bacterium]